MDLDAARGVRVVRVVAEGEDGGVHCLPCRGGGAGGGVFEVCDGVGGTARGDGGVGRGAGDASGGYAGGGGGVVERAVAVVYARGEVVVAAYGEPGEGNVGGGYAELGECVSHGRRWRWSGSVA